MEYKELNKQYWGQHLWARGYFVASSGNVTDEVIAEYIKNQDMEEHNKNDKIRRKILCKNRFTNRVKQGKRLGFALQIRAVDSAVITVLPGGRDGMRGAAVNAGTLARKH